VAKFVNEPIKSSNAIVNAKDGRMCTILGILAKGDQNCAGNDIMGDLFDNIDEANAHQNGNKPANNGRVLDQAETEKIKQEELKKKQEEEERKRQQEEEEARRIEEERKRNSKKHKYATAIKSFFKKIVADEEDEK
jgi:cell division protein FtsA